MLGLLHCRPMSSSPHLPSPVGLGRIPPFWFSLHPTLQSENGGFRQRDNAKIPLLVVIARMGFCPQVKKLPAFPSSTSQT